VVKAEDFCERGNGSNPVAEKAILTYLSLGPCHVTHVTMLVRFLLIAVALLRVLYSSNWKGGHCGWSAYKKKW